MAGSDAVGPCRRSGLNFPYRPWSHVLGAFPCIATSSLSYERSSTMVQSRPDKLSPSKKPRRRPRAGGWWAFSLLALPLLAQACADRPEPEAQQPPSAFIVTCDCSTSAQRDRIAQAVRRKGGEVLYIYAELHGLAVAPPRGQDAARFERALRRIPGVIAVQPDGVSQLQGCSGPAQLN